MRTQPDKQAIDTFAEFFGQHLAGTTYGQLLQAKQDAEEQAQWAKHYADRCGKLEKAVAMIVEDADTPSGLFYPDVVNAARAALANAGSEPHGQPEKPQS